MRSVKLFQCCEKFDHGDSFFYYSNDLDQFDLSFELFLEGSHAVDDYVPFVDDHNFFFDHNYSLDDQD